MANRVRELEPPAANVDVNAPPPNADAVAQDTGTHTHQETERQGGSSAAAMDVDDSATVRDPRKGKEAAAGPSEVIDTGSVKRLEAEIAAKLEAEKQKKELERAAAEAEKKRKEDEDKAAEMQIEKDKKRKELADKELAEQREREKDKKRKEDNGETTEKTTAAAADIAEEHTPIEDPGPKVSTTAASHTTSKRHGKGATSSLSSRKDSLRSSAIKAPVSPRKK